MAKTKSAADQIGAWLKENLGDHCLGGLTGQDRPALIASVYIMQSYRVSDGAAEKSLIDAFRGCVLAIAPGSRYLAFHAIAFSMDWGTRAQIWEKAGLPTLENPGRCKFE